MKYLYFFLFLACVFLVITGFILFKSVKKELFQNNTSVPKILHLTCKDKNNLSEFYKSNLDSWKKFNPNLDIRLYDDDDLQNFFKKEYPEYVDKINLFDKIIFKIDIFKLLVLHKYGGIYADMDVECLKCFDDLLNNLKKPITFGYGPYEHNNGIYKNYTLIECAIMIGKPNHPFFIDLVESIKYSEKNNRSNPVYITGPVAITNAVNNSKYKKDIEVMEPVYFYPVNNQLQIRISKEKIEETQKMLETHTFPKDSYCVHYWDGAWWNKKSKGNRN